MGTQDFRFGEARHLKEQERARERLQAEVDAKKTIEARREFGQFSTPFALADEIASQAARLCGKEPVSFLEPCLGTGAFYSAVRKHFPQLSDVTGFEIDKDYFASASSLWHDIALHPADFTCAVPDKEYGLLLTNPPYVRHHYLSKEQKERMYEAVQRELGIKVSGLSGLYCYFLLLSHKWLRKGALCAWLIPSEFMDVNYGTALKTYLLDRVQLLRIHRYDPEDSKFEDALVSSCVVWFRNEKPAEDAAVEFSFGGTHERPALTRRVPKATLRQERKWTRFPEKDVREAGEDMTLGDYFTIKRGIATGSNAFFVLRREDAEARGIERQFLRPILPSPRHLSADFIERDAEGCPKMEPQLFLLHCDLEEGRIEREHPALWAYLQSGVETVAQKYLCKNRKVWYAQEERRATPFLCSYMGRGKAGGSPIRFLLNLSDAIVTNSYLMLYPKEPLQEAIDANPALVYDIWEELKTIGASAIEDEGRVYGGGLKKIEPKELAKVKCGGLKKFCSVNQELVLLCEPRAAYKVS